MIDRSATPIGAERPPAVQYIRLPNRAHRHIALVQIRRDARKRNGICRRHIVHHRIAVDGDLHGMEIAVALDAQRPLSVFLDIRYGDRRQDDDDGNRDHQFDEREA